MPLTLDEIQSLIGALGVKIPADILEQKAKAEEFKVRREKVAAEAGGKPADWRLKAEFDALLARAVESAGQKQFDPAFKQLEQAEQLLQQPDAPPAPEPPSADSLAMWQTARAAAITRLRGIGAAIKAAKDPEADQALIVLEAVAKNLTESPATAQTVRELERYLETDEIVAEAELPNPFGPTLSLRAPLLAALAPLKAQLAPKA